MRRHFRLSVLLFISTISNFEQSLMANVQTQKKTSFSDSSDEKKDYIERQYVFKVYGKMIRPKSEVEPRLMGKIIAPKWAMVKKALSKYFGCLYKIRIILHQNHLSPSIAKCSFTWSKLIIKKHQSEKESWVLMHKNNIHGFLIVLLKFVIVLILKILNWHFQRQKMLFKY